MPCLELVYLYGCPKKRAQEERTTAKTNKKPNDIQANVVD